jgi:hypothetical protein
MSKHWREGRLKTKNRVKLKKGVASRNFPSTGMAAVMAEKTEGTETSQYLVEKKSSESPFVAASEYGE